MYSYVFDAETRGYLLTTHNEKYVPFLLPNLHLRDLNVILNSTAARNVR